LPPGRPRLKLSQGGSLDLRLRAAERALLRLELAGEMVPSLDWFIYAFVRKEAVLSSQIEGTQATLVDLLTFEADVEAGPAGSDVEEICNYLDALTYARTELANPKGLPLSIRLLNETHRRLMRGASRGGGRDKQPGEIRRTQNWIGGTRPGNAAYVPPPPQYPMHEPRLS
jgi:Fic family protein